MVRCITQLFRCVLLHLFTDVQVRVETAAVHSSPSMGVGWQVIG